MGFLGGQKNRGSSRVEGQSPQVATIPYFFFQIEFFFASSQSLWHLHFFQNNSSSTGELTTLPMNGLEKIGITI